MTDPTQTPTLDYAFPSHLEGRCNFLPLSAELQTRCRDELTAIKAENTELRAAVLDAVETMKAMDDEISALKSARPKPVRKLREVTKGDGLRFRWNPCIGPRAEHAHFDKWRECNHTQVLLYADVFEDLKKQPYELPPRTADVLHAAFDRVWQAAQSDMTDPTWAGTRLLVSETLPKVRAAVLEETGGDE